MKNIFFTIVLIFSTQCFAASPWLDNLNSPDKQQQLDLRWKAYGGQVDIKFMHKKLNEMSVQMLPKPEFPDKHWDYNHLVFDISNNSKLELQMPYGNIEKITDGMLLIDADFTFFNGQNSFNISSFKLIPTANPTNSSDIVTFNLIDQDNRHLFTIDSVHIEYDKIKELLLMSNMDLYATKTFAQLLHNPYLENQVVGQINTYSKLEIPELAIKDMGRGSCPAGHPVWPPLGDVDVALIDIGDIQYLSSHNSSGLDSSQIVIAPSARLKNIGTADVPWHSKYSGNFDPYDTDQHPFLNWSVYREVESGRFEQLANSGVKHAFLTINSNCTVNCGDSQILWLGCEDVYGVGNNDSSSAIGPREEIEADKGIWDNCGTFFDPIPCNNSQQNFSSGAGQFRLKASTSELTDVQNTGMYLQAWYLIRDDINIFNSMGYRSINPTQNGGGWNMNPGATFSNGAALDNYVDPNNIGENEFTQTVETGEGQFTVAVKVIELEGGLFRYNYAIENYEFDPRFIQYQIPFSYGDLLIDTKFVDPDQDDGNNWIITVNDASISVIGNAQNEQDWGMMFSFSFTTDLPPTFGNISIDAAHTDELVIPANATMQALTLIPQLDLIFESGFE